MSTRPSSYTSQAQSSTLTYFASMVQHSNTTAESTPAEAAETIRKFSQELADPNFSALMNVHKLTFMLEKCIYFRDGLDIYPAKTKRARPEDLLECLTPRALSKRKLVSAHKGCKVLVEAYSELLKAYSQQKSSRPDRLYTGDVHEILQAVTSAGNGYEEEEDYVISGPPSHANGQLTSCHSLAEIPSRHGRYTRASKMSTSEGGDRDQPSKRSIMSERDLPSPSKRMRKG